MMIGIAAALALADLLTTVAGVRAVGSDAESNLIFHRVISQYGVSAFAALYVVGSAAIIGISPRFEGALAGFSAVLLIAVANNLFALWWIYKTLS